MAATNHLTPAMLRVLRLMREAELDDRLEDAEVVCDAGQCWVGDERTTKATVNRLLRLTLVSDRGWSAGAEAFVINDAGRAVLRRPELAAEIEVALVASTAFTIGADDRIVALQADPATIPAMLTGSHRKGSGQIVHAIPGPFDWNFNGRALCGAKPGARSAGWAPMDHLAVTCQRCLAKQGD